MHRRLILLILALLFSVLPAGAQQDDPLVVAPVASRTGTAYDVAWSPDGSVLAVGSGYEIMIYPADLGSPPAVFDLGEIVNLVWNPDGTQLVNVGGFRNPEIRLWDWDSEVNLLTPGDTLDGNDAALGAGLRSRNLYVAAWSDQNTLAVLADDRLMRIQFWDMTTQEFISGFELLYTFPLRELAWNADGTALIGAGNRPNEEAYVLISMDLAGSATELFELPEGTAVFALSPDRSRIAVAAEDGRVTILDLANGSAVLSFEGAPGPVGLTWSPAGDRLAVLKYEVDGLADALQVWDVSEALAEDSTDQSGS